MVNRFFLCFQGITFAVGKNGFSCWEFIFPILRTCLFEHVRNHDLTQRKQRPNDSRVFRA